MRKTRGGWRETGHFSRRHRPLSQVVRVLISLLILSHYVYYLRAWHRLGEKRKRRICFSPPPPPPLVPSFALAPTLRVYSP